MGRTYSTVGENGNADNILDGKYQIKRLLGRTRRGVEDSIIKDLREIECECVDLIRLVQYVVR
jgi:hypothetical protein